MSVKSLSGLWSGSSWRTACGGLKLGNSIAQLGDSSRGEIDCQATCALRTLLFGTFHWFGVGQLQLNRNSTALADDR